MSKLLFLALFLLPASVGLAQDEEPGQEQQRPATAKPLPEPSSRLIVQAFQGALSPEQLKVLGPRASLAQLRDAMTPEQKGAARAGLAAAEAKARTPEELKEIARGYLILDENAPGQGENALRIAETLQASTPDDSEGFSLAGSAFHQMGDYPAAAQWARRALEINPNDERARAVYMLSKDRIKRGAGSSPGVTGTAAGLDGMTAAGAEFFIPEKHDIAPQALGLVRQAIAARKVGDMAGTWNNVQAAMNADPTSKSVQKLYEMAKADQARHVDTKEYLRLSREAMDAGRNEEAVAWAQKAFDRSGNPTVKQILDLTRQTADTRAQETAKKDLEAAAAAKKNTGKGLHPLTTAAMIAGVLLLAWAATPQAVKDDFKAKLWDNPKQELQLAAVVAVAGLAAWQLGPSVVSAARAVLAAAGPPAQGAQFATAGAGASGGVVGGAVPAQEAALGTLKAALLAGGAWAMARGSGLVSFAKSESGDGSSRAESGKPTAEQRLRKAGLPQEGDFRFEPPKKYHPGNRLPVTDDGKGFVDRYGNIWRKGPYHGKPGLFESEWDVQLSETGMRMWGRFARGKGYINVRPDGMLSH